MVDLVDDTGARGIPVVGSATYFNAGGAPQISTNNLARVTADFRAGSRNIIIISTTNDFDQGTSAGTNYFNTAKTQGLTWLAAGWEVWVVRHRIGRHRMQRQQRSTLKSMCSMVC